MKAYNCAILARNKIIECVVLLVICVCCVMFCYVLSVLSFLLSKQLNVFYCWFDIWWITILYYYVVVCLFFFISCFLLFIFCFCFINTCMCAVPRNFALCLLADVIVSVYCPYYSNCWYTLLLEYIIQAIEWLPFTLNLLLAYCPCLFDKQLTFSSA